MSDPDSPPLAHDPSPAPPQALLPPPLPSTADPKITSIPATTTSKASRRLPPPCWSLEETIALIDAYREKWHALSRGNLRANHWEGVAEAVAATCPDVAPRKTAVQCRHKMEKLRQRHRTEIQRARSGPGPVPVARFVSSWVHYKRMEDMEHRGETKPVNETDYQGGETKPVNETGYQGGIRIRIPTGVSIAQTGSSFPTGVSTKPRPGRVGEGTGKRGSEMMMMSDADPIASAIKLLGDTMLRTEEKKMEMTREMEAMRMEMEMKRTEMVLESQQRIVEAFAKTMSEKKKEKKARSYV